MRNIFTAFGFAMALAASPAAAQITPAFEYTSASTLGESRSFTLGFAFNLTQATTINALGYWTGGTLSSHQVGIWDISGNLLSSGTVSAADTVQGHYAWDSIAPLLLGAGDYVIGGEYLGGVFPNSLTGVTTAPGYNWVVDRQVGGGFAFPTTPLNGEYGQNGIALVNFSTGQSLVAAVPEPATWAMMLIGFGAIGVSMRRRREADLPHAA